MVFRRLSYPVRTDANPHEVLRSHFHGDNMGSNPIGDTNPIQLIRSILKSANELCSLRINGEVRTLIEVSTYETEHDRWSN